LRVRRVLKLAAVEGRAHPRVLGRKAASCLKGFPFLYKVVSTALEHLGESAASMQMGHLLGGTLAVFWMLSPLPTWAARAFAMATLIGSMLLSGAVHPPAGALVLALMDSAKLQSLKWWYLIYPGLAGLLWIIPVASLCNYFKARYQFTGSRIAELIFPKSA